MEAERGRREEETGRQNETEAGDELKRNDKSPIPYINKSNVNLMAAPGMGGSVIKPIEKGTNLRILGTYTSGGTVWYEVMVVDEYGNAIITNTGEVFVGYVSGSSITQPVSKWPQTRPTPDEISNQCVGDGCDYVGTFGMNTIGDSYEVYHGHDGAEECIVIQRTASFNANCPWCSDNNAHYETHGEYVSHSCGETEHLGFSTYMSGATDVQNIVGTPAYSYLMDALFDDWGYDFAYYNPDAGRWNDNKTIY